jgi:ketosteroid isomerase-like protein
VYIVHNARRHIEFTREVSPAVVTGLTAWAAGDFDRLAEILDADVELLASEPGLWDCHGRDAVIGLLTQRRAEGHRPFDVRLEPIDDHTLVVSRAGTDEGDHRNADDEGGGAGATRATIRDGKVVRMQQYRNRAAALAATD